MRHLKSGRKLNRTPSHRKSMLFNLTISVLKYKKIKTTLVKAKEVRKIVEKLISKGKCKTIANKRLVFKILKNRTLVYTLFNSIAIKYLNCKGGYTRLFKCGFRKGDGALMSIIQLV